MGGVPMDLVREAELYKSAAEKGHLGAIYNLAICYENGDGVGVSASEAACHYEMAAHKGHVNAQFNVAMTYENGQDGVPKNVKKALDFYTLAARQGDAEAE